MASYNANLVHGHPAQAIACFLDVIEALSIEGRRLWSACSARRFNVGYECSVEPFYSAWQVSSMLLERMALVHATFVVTIYRSSEESKGASS